MRNADRPADRVVDRAWDKPGLALTCQLDPRLQAVMQPQLAFKSTRAVFATDLPQKWSYSTVLLK